jgi:O-antigen/teichoic acid export membrane protein
LFGIIATLFERWLIQKEGGSAQQGFYGLSYQIGAICILFTSAMSSLMMREFAIAFQEHAIDKMAQMFRRYVPFLYTVAAYFACFVCIEAQKITYIFGGSKFENAVIPVMIMAFYPIHQTYGQLNSTIFLATGQTKIYSIISLIFYVIGLPVAYFFIISFEKFGLDSVATGMALKMIIIQFLAVNVQLFFHSRYLKLSFIKYFAHQIISVSFLLLVAILSNKIISLLPELDSNKLKSVIASGFIYSVMVLIAIILLPMIFGLHRNDIRFAFVEIKKRLNPEKFNLR